MHRTLCTLAVAGDIVWEDMLKLKLHEFELSVSRLPPTEKIPKWVVDGSFWSVTKSDTELSVTTESKFVPPGTTSEPGWLAIEVVGPLDFGLVGILSHLLEIFAQAGVPVFCLSTFDSDYVLFNRQHKELVLALLIADDEYTMQ